MAFDWQVDSPIPKRPRPLLPTSALGLPVHALLQSYSGVAHTQEGLAEREVQPYAATLVSLAAIGTHETRLVLQVRDPLACPCCPCWRDVR